MTREGVIIEDWEGSSMVGEGRTGRQRIFISSEGEAKDGGVVGLDEGGGDKG